MIEKRNTAGREAETNDDLDLAIENYEENIKEDAADAFSYARLMIIYRKLKKPKETTNSYANFVFFPVNFH